MTKPVHPFYAAKTTKPRRKRVMPMKPATKAAVTAVVKQVIARETENKYVGWKIEANVAHNSAIGTGDPQPILGDIVLGTSSQNRLGEKIRPKRLTVSGTLSMQSTSFNTSQVLYARVIIAAQKTIKTSAGVAGNVDVMNLLSPGFTGAATQQFTGIAQELSYPVNRDSFRVYMDKIVKLCPVYTLTANQGIVPTPNSCFRWSYTFKKMPSAFSFDATNGDKVLNFAPFVAIGYCYADGTSPDVVATKLNSCVNSRLIFEDA